MDGEAAPEISQVIFDPEKNRAPGPEELWMPARPPSDTSLLVSALADLVTSPGGEGGIARARAAFNDVTTSVTEAVSALGKLAEVVRTATQVAPGEPAQCHHLAQSAPCGGQDVSGGLSTHSCAVRVRDQRCDPDRHRGCDAELVALAR